MQLTLDDEQAAELRTLVATALSDLSHEIADTDNPSFRSDLRKRRELLQSVLDSLGR